MRRFLAAVALSTIMAPQLRAQAKPDTLEVKVIRGRALTAADSASIRTAGARYVYADTTAQWKFSTRGDTAFVSIWRGVANDGVRVERRGRTWVATGIAYYGIR